MRLSLPLFILLTLRSVACHSHGPDEGSCGVKGYDTSRPKPYSISTQQEHGSNYGCQRFCAVDKKCESYGFGKGKCKLYTAPIKDNIVHRDDGPFTFYNRACIDHMIQEDAIKSSLISAHAASASARAAAMSRMAKRQNAPKASAPFTGSTPGPTKVARAVSPTIPAICGRQGYHQGIPHTFQYDWRDGTTNFACCRHLCHAQGCESFAYEQGACLLFDTNIMNGVESGRDSPYKFFDRGCQGQMCLL